jgi:cobalamin transport system substrate-binding protein
MTRRDMTRLMTLVAVIALAACKTRQPEAAAPTADRTFARTLRQNPTECVEQFDPSADYFPDKAVFESARQVSVSYHGHYKVVTVTFRGFTDNPAYNSTERYVLVQCGTPAPSLSGALAGAQIISIPAHTVTVTNNEDLGMMIALGLRDQIKSVGSRAIYDDELWRKFQLGTLPVTFGWGTSEIHVEWMLDLKPDIVVIGAFQSQAARNMQRAYGAGLQTIPSLTRVEPTPLGRAEWLKALAAVFNLESTANRFYAQVSDSYRQMSARARTASDKPSAFWASTYAPGDWSAARNSFQARLLEDAGAVNALADDGPTFGVKVSAELIVERGGDADFWINENSNLVDEHGGVAVPGTPLESLRAVRVGQVFHVARRIRVENQGCDYYQTGPHRPDLVLKDLISIFQPDLEPGYEPFFLGRQSAPASVRSRAQSH